MTNKSLLTTGIIGTVIAALCCFTPLLVVTLTAVGLSAIVGGVDYVLFPVMFASMGLPFARRCKKEFRILIIK